MIILEFQAGCACWNNTGVNGMIISGVTAALLLDLRLALNEENHSVTVKFKDITNKAPLKYACEYHRPKERSYYFLN